MGGTFHLSRSDERDASRPRPCVEIIFPGVLGSVGTLAPAVLWVHYSMSGKGTVISCYDPQRIGSNARALQVQCHSTGRIPVQFHPRNRGSDAYSTIANLTSHHDIVESTLERLGGVSHQQSPRALFLVEKHSPIINRKDRIVSETHTDEAIERQIARQR